MDELTQLPGESVEITVSPQAAGGRVDKVLADALRDWSRERLKSVFEAGMVTLNGAPTVKKTRVAEGDVIALILPDRPSTKVEPMDVPLDILFEDEYLVAINKPCGMVTHPGAAVEPPTLCHALLHYTDGKLAKAGGEERPGVVHRLDKATTGVIVFAKTDEAYYALVQAFSQRLTKKEYLAIVTGSPQLEAGSIREPIERDLQYRTRMAVREDGKPAHTDWHIVERLDERHCLVHCRIHTGRTHQIRVHLSHLGMILLGDSTYGYRPRQGQDWHEDFFLHAASLILPHPITGEPLEITAELPPAFQDQLVKLRA
ncbi:RluA family pseudouridine synthase [Cerasicoccus arenae]|uniref:Pseudouridine synthase n=1 Tax=Cerasicoccus arenae TaxID=424488 RepID=A0A8J3DA28_9BACT|nr:RluA family pseudouridine synthase [Cerasicoccus arenae]MBK1857526.1 RluA family pseudouridine synthase [Cerasicoccus arenae]GHB95517.1 pseudouridine synthase [Cerasicoccus arenae]